MDIGFENKNILSSVNLWVHDMTALAAGDAALLPERIGKHNEEMLG